MTTPTGTLYIAPGKYTKPMKDFLASFNYQYKSIKLSPGSYERTTKGYFEDLEREQLRLLNFNRNKARTLKDNYDSAKSGIDKKINEIFYPGSNSFNEQTKQTSLMQRNLAITRLSSGSIDKEAFSKEIESNFKNGNIDYNAEAYNYLLNDKKIPAETSFHLLSKLREGFDKRGLSEVKELKQDLAEGEEAYNEIKKKFQL